MKIFTLIAIVYYCLNILFPTDFSKNAVNAYRVFPQTAAAILSAYSIILAFFSIRSIWRNRMMRAFLFLLVLAIAYIVYPFRPSENIAYIMRTYMGIITMFALYSTRCRTHDDRAWKRCVYLIYSLQLAYCLYSLLMDKMAHNVSASLEFDSNAGFMLLTCIPMALTIPFKRIRVYVYALLVLACIYSGQRSAALAAVISFPLCLWYLRGVIKKSDMIVLSLLGVIVAVPVLIAAVQNFQTRTAIDVSQGNIGSGRTIFWLITVQDFFSHGPVRLLFGNGTNSVADLLYVTYGHAIGAHNGWLDMLYTFGFVGVICYGYIFFMFLRRNKVVEKDIPNYKNMYLILFIIFFFKSITSHGFFDVSSVPFLTTVAMMEGLRDKIISKRFHNTYEREHEQL